MIDIMQFNRRQRNRLLRKPVPPRRPGKVEEDRRPLRAWRLVFRYLTLLLLGVVIAVPGMATVIAAAWLYYAPQLPDIEAIRDISLQTPLRVYTRDGRLIGEFGEKRRIPVAYEDVPSELVLSFLAAEDDGFFDHPGVDLFGLLRAFLEFVRSGEFRSGGSTITMQVARNYFLTRDRNITRKLKEILLAMQIERTLSKPEILELYVNKIYMGKRAYGAAAAALVYYGRELSSLSLAQYAMLAGLPKAPSTFNPIVNPQRALIRRNWILGRLRALNYQALAHLSIRDWEEAAQQPITARYHLAPVEVDAQHLAEMARSEMVRRYGTAAYENGYRVYTTVDSVWQQAGQKAVVDGVVDYDWRHGWRGPEKHLGGADQGNLGEAELQRWRTALSEMREINGLVPAVIVQVEGQGCIAQLAAGAEIRLEWDQGLSEAREHINENLLGPPPRRAADVVAVGDVVRLLHTGERWLLRQLPQVEAGLVAIDPSNGAVRTLVGGFEFFQNKFNHVTQGKRQPGSGMKPFIYAAALDNGFTTASIFNDAPVVFNDSQLEGVWRPTNDGGRFSGPTRLRKALYLSRNLVSIRLLRKMGVDKALEALKTYGFDTRDMRHDLSLALGSHAMTPMELVTGYAVFANGGYRVKPWIIREIHNINGEVLYRGESFEVPGPSCEEARWKCRAADIEGAADAAATGEEAPEPQHAPRVMDDRIAYIMDSILRDVVKRGTGRRARRLGRDDLAGKTGTTNGPVDAWFSGYTQQLVATSWLGFDQNRYLGRNEYGGSAALPIWIDFMRTSLNGQQELPREQPDGLVVVRIDPDTGDLAEPGQRGAITEIFRHEHAPVGAVSEEGATLSPEREEAGNRKRRNRSQKIINQLF